MNKIRINILALAAIGAALVGILAVSTTGESQLATLAVAGSLVGGFAGVMTRLSDPEPDPSVPSSIVERILQMMGGESASGAAELFEPASQWRPNVLVLVIVAAVIVAGMVFVISSEAALITVAGGFVGGIVSLAGKLTDPPPNPSVPASVVAKLLEHKASAAQS